MTNVKLVDRYPRWTKTERRQLAGQVAELTDETDHAGKRLAVLRSGPLLGCGVWVSDGEIAEINEEAEVGHECLNSLNPCRR